MAFLSLLFLPVGLMLRQQIPRLIDEVKKLLRQVPLQHIQHPVDALQQPVGKAPFFLQRLFQFHVLIPESFKLVLFCRSFHPIHDIALQDAFVLGTSGTFDDSYSEYGSVSQTFTCTSGCTQKTYKNRSVSSSNTIDEDLSFDYERFIPVMHFVPISPRCDYCTGGARDYYFSAYIRYGMIADESVNIQAGYAHKTIGFGDISVGIDVNGTPSFSASVATVVPYVARAVTVTY